MKGYRCYKHRKTRAKIISVIRIVLPAIHHSSSHLQAEGSVKKMEQCSSGKDPVSESDCEMSNGSEGACVTVKNVEWERSWPILWYCSGKCLEGNLITVHLMRIGPCIILIFE